MTSEIINVESLTYQYALTERPALLDINLTVDRGEYLAIVGPCGAGKTTLALSMNGIVPHMMMGEMSGRVLVDGRDTTQGPVREMARTVGMVFDNPEFQLSQSSVLSEMALGLENIGVPREEMLQRITEALEIVGLSGFEERSPMALSGGQQQRVAVARALVFEPKLVLMDEPLGALDRQLREQMQYEIKHIHENLGVTVVYVTHDQAEALTMSNRVCVFDDGVVQQVAAPNILYEQPTNAFVAQFIGENNTFTAAVKEVNGDQCMTQVETGETLTALAINIAGPGTNTTLSLRPERVTINPEAGQCANVVSGVVKELIYLGDHIRARLELCGQDQFIVKVPNAARHSHLTEGESVVVGWHSEDCRALDAPA